ncbi:MAG: tRNA (N(6)-L-threonylcarbamoyladenosine(37)-C(2))-methylthiotransferase [Candidatus Bathyarchaeia archaeon]
MRVFVKSFGCSTNLADGEVLSGCLAEAGYELANDASCADVIVYNTCAVKGPTENRMFEILKRVPNGKKLIVAGCLPLINFERLCREVRFDGVVGPAAGEKIVFAVEKVLMGEKVSLLDKAARAMPSLMLPRVHLNPVVGVIPISYGCLGSCSYCCVIYARGRLRSYRIEDITERLKTDLAFGVREFWLTSQDTACYGMDIGANLAELLTIICSIRGDFMIRVGMMTPNMALRLLKNLVQAYKHEKIFKFIHLPVQSGDDTVLKGMQRFYKVKDFKYVIETLRAEFPKITLATDIICGFPGEDKEAFNRTLHLLEEVKPDIVNVSKFFARPRTQAAKMENQVPYSEIKRRSAEASLLARKIAWEKNMEWIGWEGPVFVDEAGKVRGTWIGRNFAYKPIVIRSEDSLLGKFVRVKVINAHPLNLEGQILSCIEASALNSRIKKL